MAPHNVLDQQKKGDFLAADQAVTTNDRIPHQRKIVWLNVYNFVVLHLLSLIGLYLAVFHAKWQTVALGAFFHLIGGIGITAGAHRLWAHRSFKAKLPLQAILLFFQTIAFQNDVIEWSRDHRCHHKWSETDADPHDATRGFFFAHMGWLLEKKHPEVIRRGKTLDMSDLLADPLLRFQRRHYKKLVALVSFALPTVIAVQLWAENPWIAVCIAGFLRYTVTLHATWCINSFAHMWGNRPYDARISPRENIFTAINALGEGWHNYHHTFPQDYKTSEVPWLFNGTTMLIDGFAAIGWAYDCKAMTHDVIERQKQNHGE